MADTSESSAGATTSHQRAPGQGTQQPAQVVALCLTVQVINFGWGLSQLTTLF